MTRCCALPSFTGTDWFHHHHHHQQHNSLLPLLQHSTAAIPAAAATTLPLFPFPFLFTIVMGPLVVCWFRHVSRFLHLLLILPACSCWSYHRQWFFPPPLFILLLFLLVLLLLFPPRLRQPQWRGVFCVTCFSDPVVSSPSLLPSLLLNCLTPSLPPTFLLPYNCVSAYSFVLP